MSSKLLGALALGYGTNALLNKQQQQPGMTGQTPGFGDQLKSGVQQGFQAAIPDLVQAGLTSALGFDGGGKVHAPVYAQGGGLWSGLKEVIPFLDSVEQAKGVLAQQAENRNRALAGKDPLPVKTPLGGGGALSPEQRAAVIEQTKKANQALLHEPIGGYQKAEDLIKPIDFLHTPLDASYRSTGGTAATKKDKVRYKKTGGALAAPMGNVSFMMEHEPNFKEKVGPLAKTMYKSSGGEVYERAYHNPLAAKPDGGKAKEA